MLRFPDTHSRIHALTKADNLGLGCVVLGVILLDTEAARVLFTWTVSLLPGSVGARMRDRELTIHVLDRLDHVEEKLARLEAHIAALFRDNKG